MPGAPKVRKYSTFLNGLRQDVTNYRPIKTTALSNTTNKNPRNTKTEQSPPSNIEGKGKVTAVVAVAKYGPDHHHKSSKKASKEKLIRVLLDSGSDGDLLFHEKGTPKHFP